MPSLIAFYSRNLGIRFVFEFGPPFLHVSQFNCLWNSLLNVWHFESILIL